MTRFVFYIILVFTLVSCDADKGSCYDVQERYHILTSDLEKGGVVSLSPIECTMEIAGDKNESVEVTYFFIMEHKDTLLWEEGVLKLPIKNR